VKVRLRTATRAFTAGVLCRVSGPGEAMPTYTVSRMVEAGAGGGGEVRLVSAEGLGAGVAGAVCAVSSGAAAGVCPAERVPPGSALSLGAVVSPWQAARRRSIAPVATARLGWRIIGVREMCEDRWARA
jgi:hypothetical protein